jgi:hypothetical protein
VNTLFSMAYVFLMCLLWFMCHTMYCVYVCYGLCARCVSLSFVPICKVLVIFWGVY